MGVPSASGGAAVVLPSSDVALRILADESARAAGAATELGDPLWRKALEAWMLALAPAAADLLGQTLRESRGAWLLLLPAARSAVPGEPPCALVVGRSLAGSGPALVRLGWSVTLLDPDRAANRLAEARGRLTAAEVGCVASPDELEPGSFDLVLVEESACLDPAEAARFSRDLVAITADNLLAYKSSSGQRADFRLTPPATFLRRLLFGERGADRSGRSSLTRLRRELRSWTGAPVRAAALYPDRRDYSHAIDLDHGAPSLTIGPKERRNRIKLLGYRAGLFARLAPSYGLWSSRRRPQLVDGAGAASTKHSSSTAAHGDVAEPQGSMELPDQRLIDRLLGELVARLDCPLPVAEHLVATRGNTALVQTRARASAHPSSAGPAAAGRWTLRIPLGHRPLAAARQGIEGTRWMRAHFPHVPVAEPFFAGRLELPVAAAGPGAAASPDARATGPSSDADPGRVTAIELTVEERIDGLGAGQLSGDARAMGRLFVEAGALLASLETRPPKALDEHDFAQLFGRAFDEVRPRVGDESTHAALVDLQDELRQAALGLVVPRVACHSDLRPKHVLAQVEGPATERGRLLGIVDWSCLEPAGVPLYDLVHLITQERAQAPGSSSARAWHAIQERTNLMPAEREAVAAYETTLGLPTEWYGLVARAYPVLFGAMAEAHWDYSRPRWLRRLFGVGVR